MCTAETPVGWRERKKAKTRLRIQSCALRLFLEQGYDATTVEQITEAAEVSESTLYRFFPAKRDLVLTDELDDLFLEEFRNQPRELGPIQAIQASFHSVLDGVSEQERTGLRDRLSLVLAVPELRSTMLDQLAGAMAMLGAAVAERTGRPAGSPEVRTLSGAVMGASMSVLFVVAEDPDADLLALLDESMAYLAEAWSPDLSGPPDRGRTPVADRKSVV